MKVHRGQTWTGGWFVGDFEPSAYKTEKFEVCLKRHPKGERWPKHYHKVATEINYLIRGKMTILGQALAEGDVFVIDPGEIADPEFLEDCEIIVIKTPSLKKDKYEIN
jgi:quercetin dioxygenase-like cupin family protein